MKTATEIATLAHVKPYSKRTINEKLIALLQVRIIQKRIDKILKDRKEYMELMRW